MSLRIINEPLRVVMVKLESFKYILQKLGDLIFFFFSEIVTHCNENNHSVKKNHFQENSVTYSLKYISFKML